MGKRLREHIKKFSTKAPIERDEQMRFRRIGLLTEDAYRSSRLLPDTVSSGQALNREILALPITRGKRGGVLKGFGHGVIGGLRYVKKPQRDLAHFWESEISRRWSGRHLGYSLWGGGACALDYYYYPASPEVFKATVGNMAQLLIYKEVFVAALTGCSRCGQQGAMFHEGTATSLCLACWPSKDNASPPEALVRFGQPLAK